MTPMFQERKSARPLTSIVSYPERGEGGNNKYLSHSFYNREETGHP
jgi:hypothetical protein